MEPYNSRDVPLVLDLVPVRIQDYEPCERPFVLSSSNFVCREVSSVVGIVSKVDPSVLPSIIPSSSPNSDARKILYLWQRNLSYDEENIAPSLNPSVLPIEHLDLVPEKECFADSGSSASDLCNQVPNLVPTDIHTIHPVIITVVQGQCLCQAVILPYCPVFCQSNLQICQNPISESKPKQCQELSS